MDPQIYDVVTSKFVFLDPAAIQDQLKFDYRPNLGWYVLFALRLLAGIACFLAVLFGYLICTSSSKLILIVLCSVVALESGITSFGYLSDGLRRDSFVPLVDTVAFWVLAAALTSSEGAFPPACLAFGAIICPLRVKS